MTDERTRRSLASGRARRALAVLAATLFVVSVLSTSVTAEGAPTRPSSDGSAPSATENGTVASVENALAFDYAFERLPERPGSVRVVVTTTVPDNVTRVTVSPPDGATVTGTVGYDDDTGPDEWVWERTAGATATMTYVVNVNASDDGRVEAVDTGDWALFDWRALTLHWTYTRTAGAPEPAVVERPAGTVGPGVVGTGFAYLGPYARETRIVEGETIELVVPAAADPVEAPGTVADALATASASLRVGARSDRVIVYVAPAPIEATGRLSQGGNVTATDVYVSADARLETADNAWFHEYVHSRQSYEAGENLAWVDEGTAEYYAALLAYRQGLVPADEFHAYVRTDRASDAVLAEAAPRAPASYFKGMRVVAATDAGIRTATDGQHTLESVFRAMNAHDGPVTLDVAAGFVGDVAGERRADRFRADVVSTGAPTVPTLSRDSDDGVGSALVEESGLGDGTVPPAGAALFVAGVVLALATLRFR
ncbi:MAG: hypothetical protein V5A62_18780 [Haloarculaceae archaeon]